MFLIEPCCTQKHWPAFRKKLGTDGTAFFHGYGDLALGDLLPVILPRYPEAEMTLVCPSLPDRATEVLMRWMRKTWAKADGKGNIDAISSLTIITDLREQKSPIASHWLKENPFPIRLLPYNVSQNDTALIFPDLAIYGNINLAHNSHFTAMATKDARIINDLRQTYTNILQGRKS